MIHTPQHTPAGRALRAMSRALWRRWYRAERITASEMRLAMHDMMIFGTGFLMLTNEGTRCLAPATVTTRRR